MEKVTEMEKKNQSIKKEKSNCMPIWKFILLSIVTFGLYEIFWSYKNWKLIKVKSGEELSPFWRSIFGILFIYSLCNHANKLAEEKGYEKSIFPGFMSIGYILLTLMSNLPDPYWAIGFLACLALIPTVQAFNYYWNLEQPDIQVKNSLSFGEVVVVVIGGALFIMIMLGLFIFKW